VFRLWQAPGAALRGGPIPLEIPIMYASLLTIAATLALSGPTDGQKTNQSEARSILGTVQMIDDAIVSAEESGPLMELTVKAGQRVERGQCLGQIKDTKARAGRDLAHAEAEVARKEAENDIDVRYAEKQYDVAKTTLRLYEETNANPRMGKGKVIPVTEMLKIKLESERAELQIEQAKFKTKVGKLQHDAKLAAVAAADDDIDRRKIASPLDGEVREVMQKRGQWVNPGDAIFHVVDMRKLRVVANISSLQFDAHEIDGREVQIVVELKRGQATFAGRVVFVDRQVVGDQFKVHIEVENRQENGHWVLLEGKTVEVILDGAAPPEAEEIADRR
jgi:multidrug resistance efflux pump